MMNRFCVTAAIVVLVVIGFADQAAAGEASVCSQEIHGQLVIDGAGSPCLPFEVCLGMADYEDALRFRIGMHHIGGDYYTLSGIEFDQFGNPSALSGSAVKIDNSLSMTVTVVTTVTGDKVTPYIMSKMGKITLDLKTADVSFAMIDIKAYMDGSEHIGDSYDALNYIACPGRF
jgi:hypothetical protein